MPGLQGSTLYNTNLGALQRVVQAWVEEEKVCAELCELVSLAGMPEVPDIAKPPPLCLTHVQAQEVVPGPGQYR
jgi:hypothetical protein